MTDEKVIKTFIELLENRVTISTQFLQDDETGNLTHQFLILQAGDIILQGEPEALEMPLRVALPSETGATVN